jgi:hypothetical protein
MKFEARMQRLAALVTLGVATAAAPQMAQAGMLGGLLGNGADSAAPHRAERVWQLGKFSFVRIVAEESGAAPNAQPVKLDRDVLATWLRRVQMRTADGLQHLFARDEARALAPALVEALAQAGPEQDVVFSSAARRDGAFLIGPTAVTGRVFVTDGELNLIVHDARKDFYDQYRGTMQMPVFTYGSRHATGTVQLHCDGAVNVQDDWLRIALGASAAQQTQTAPTLLGRGAASALQAPAAQVAPIPAAPNSPEAIEHRLAVLKDAYSRGLITQQEYESKRAELVKLF